MQDTGCPTGSDLKALCLQLSHTGAGEGRTDEQTEQGLALQNMVVFPFPLYLLQAFLSDIGYAHTQTFSCPRETPSVVWMLLLVTAPTGLGTAQYPADGSS